MNTKKILLLGVLMATTMQAKLALESPDIKEGEPIDPRYTCQGDNNVPQLSWSGVPENTQSFVLIVDDPDAPKEKPWVHWVIYNIPAKTTQLQVTQEQRRAQEWTDGTLQGITDFNNIGFDGPCPPPGKAHRYYFKLFALDTKLNIKSGATKEEVLAALKGHELASAELMVTYERK